MQIKGMDGQHYNVTGQGKGISTQLAPLQVSLLCWASTWEAFSATAGTAT